MAQYSFVSNQSNSGIDDMGLARYKYPLSTLPVRMADAMHLPHSSKHPVRFIIEKGNWSIKWDGHYVAREVDKISPSLIVVEENPFLLSHKIAHFGSQFQFVSWYKHMARSNRMVCTFFHGKKSDDAGMARHVDEFLEGLPYLDKVITAASLIERRLLEWGVPREKLVRIPIGVDCNLFKPFSESQRRAAREKYGIKDHQLVIGSFQKDGVGWGDGMEPKLIKGPDVLVDVAKRLAKDVPVFVLLTGPARGFVKKHLDDEGIPYAHEFLEDYLDLPSRFAPLDVYINPSREEGGPKGILEAMASGVFVASTKVGMAEDVIVSGRNGVLVDVGDVEALALKILDACSNRDRMRMVTDQAREDILNYDWSKIGRAHYDLVYKDMV